MKIHTMMMKMMKMMMMMTTLVFLRAEPSGTHAWTTASAPTGGVNLQGKMFTLSSSGGGVTLYPGSYSPTQYTTPNPYDPTRYPYRSTSPYRTTRYPYRSTSPYRTTRYPYRTTSRYRTTSPYRTTRYPYNTTRYPPYDPPTSTLPAPKFTTTTPSSTTTPPRSVTGFSICLRHTAIEARDLFRFSFNSSLRVTLPSPSYYSLDFGSDSYILSPGLYIWENILDSIWTSVCFVLDSNTSVIQAFSGGYMSVRKVLRKQYSWHGAPQIYFSGFDGQVTDVQVWDYPLQYQELRNYLSYAPYGWYRGSALTWFDVSYSNTGYALLEDSYESLNKEPIRRRGGGARGGRRGGRGGRRRKFSMGGVPESGRL